IFAIYICAPLLNILSLFMSWYKFSVVINNDPSAWSLIPIYGWAQNDFSQWEQYIRFNNGIGHLSPIFMIMGVINSIAPVIFLTMLMNLRTYRQLEKLRQFQIYHNLNQDLLDICDKEEESSLSYDENKTTKKLINSLRINNIFPYLTLSINFLVFNIFVFALINSNLLLSNYSLEMDPRQVYIKGLDLGQIIPLITQKIVLIYKIGPGFYIYLINLLSYSSVVSLFKIKYDNLQKLLKSNKIPTTSKTFEKRNMPNKSNKVCED
ncbi:MAG: hypothetical protein ACTSU2_13040, partial [Promethearchaeota archaeon]